MSESTQSVLDVDDAPVPADAEEEWDENDEGEYDEDEDEDGDDDIDVEAEALEMARKLNEQILSMGEADTTSTPMPTPTPAPPQPSVAPASSKKEETFMVTIKLIMALLNRDPVAHTHLAFTPVPNSPFSNVIDALKQIISSGKVTKPTASALSQTLVGLVGSEVLFGSIKARDSKLGMLGKRKRGEEIFVPPPQPPSIHSMVSEAVHTVTHALHTSSSINPALITSIQQALHQVFLFSISSSSKPSSASPTLQEITGLIQVLGILSGLQIGVNTTHTSGPATDISTMVYPCMDPSCTKTFVRLFDLRTHEQIHHPHNQPHQSSLYPTATATYERPFPCTSCSASFLRSHDLKRHVKVTHERKAFQCGGCAKTFSRRDAVKRHRDASVIKAQQPGSLGKSSPLCHEAEILEVEGGEDTVDESNLDGGDALPDAKRARIDDEVDNVEEEEEEEGEIPESMIVNTQNVVLQLHPLLKAVVAKASGTALPLISLPSGAAVNAPAPNSTGSTGSNPASTQSQQQEHNAAQPNPPSATTPSAPTDGGTAVSAQPTTLANVIARAQSLPPPNAAATAMDVDIHTTSPPVLPLTRDRSVSAAGSATPEPPSFQSNTAVNIGGMIHALSPAQSITPSSSASASTTSSSYSTTPVQPPPSYVPFSSSSLPSLPVPSSLYPTPIQSAQQMHLLSTSSSFQAPQPSILASLSSYGLSDGQTRLLEEVIAKATLVEKVHANAEADVQEGGSRVVGGTTGVGDGGTGNGGSEKGLGDTADADKVIENGS